MEYGLLIVIIACLIGFIMTWGVGASDLANVMSTTMASQAITVRQAMMIAIVFEFAGACIGGIHVTNTIRSGIINTMLFAHSPEILVYGMMSTLIAGMIWMLSASFIGMPVSITNAIVGAIVGFGAIVLGVHAVHWNTVGAIAVSWICSPLIAGIIAFLLFVIVRRLILAANDPMKKAKIFLPFFFFLVGIVLAIMVVLKDFSDFNVALTALQKFGITVLTAIIIVIIGIFLCHRIYLPSNPKRYQKFEYIEKLFGVLMGFTACAMVYAHGSNDVAIAVGPVAAIYSIIQHHGNVSMADPLAMWIIVMGCIGVIAGLLMYGRKVIETVGKNITALTPSRAFSATLAAAVTVIVSTSWGIPVSATQTLVGGVFGVGLARGIAALNLRVMRNIILSWVITVPATAILAILFFNLFKATIM